MAAGLAGPRNIFWVRLGDRGAPARERAACKYLRQLEMHACNYTLQQIRALRQRQTNVDCASVIVIASHMHRLASSRPRPAKATHQPPSSFLSFALAIRQVRSVRASIQRFCRPATMLRALPVLLSSLALLLVSLAPAAADGIGNTPDRALLALDRVVSGALVAGKNATVEYVVANVGAGYVELLAPERKGSDRAQTLCVTAAG